LLRPVSPSCPPRDCFALGGRAGADQGHRSGSGLLQGAGWDGVLRWMRKYTVAPLAIALAVSRIAVLVPSGAFAFTFTMSFKGMATRSPSPATVPRNVSPSICG